MSKIKEYKKYLLIIAIIIIVLILIIIIKKIDQSQEENITTTPIEIVETEQIEKQEKIIIHITGEVKKEGIIEIDEGSRIADAIEKADGLTEEADISKVNLAYELEDGQKIYIPSIYDEEISDYIDDGIDENVLIEDIESSENKIIDINKAGVEELQELTGIGESIAEGIVKYREENGKFKQKEDIKNVSGIGESKYELIKDYIEV